MKLKLKFEKNTKSKKKRSRIWCWCVAVIVIQSSCCQDRHHHERLLHHHYFAITKNFIICIFIMRTWPDLTNHYKNSFDCETHCASSCLHWFAGIMNNISAMKIIFIFHTNYNNLLFSHLLKYTNNHVMKLYFS